MRQYNKFLNANRDKLTPAQKRTLEKLHDEGKQINYQIHYLKQVLNARPQLPRTINAENFAKTSHLFDDYFVRARRALAAMPDAIKAKRLYREKTFAVIKTICSEIKHSIIDNTVEMNVTANTNNNMVENFIAAAKAGEPWAKAIMEAAKGFTDAYSAPAEKSADEFARIIPKKIAVVKRGTFSADRKSAVELFNKLRKALSDEKWLEHPENRILVDFRSV